MEGIEYLYEICEALPRCGPGDNVSTSRAFKSIPNLPDVPLILDIGCGTGMQTIELARHGNSKILALDNYQGFLDILMDRAREDGMAARIEPVNRSMLDMDFDNNTFDLIWSEGALYCMGFREGLKRCHQLLKQDGYLAATELVYLMAYPPNEVLQFFEQEYPDIKGVRGKIKQIQNEGFQLVSNFTLPESAWLKNYYLPMEKELPGLKNKYRDNNTALRIFDALHNEIDFYKKYAKYYGYEFFVMQKE